MTLPGTGLAATNVIRKAWLWPVGNQLLHRRDEIALRLGWDRWWYRADRIRWRRIRLAELILGDRNGTRRRTDSEGDRDARAVAGIGCDHRLSGGEPGLAVGAGTVSQGYFEVSLRQPVLERH